MKAAPAHFASAALGADERVLHTFPDADNGDSQTSPGVSCTLPHRLLAHAGSRQAEGRRARALLPRAEGLRRAGVVVLTVAVGGVNSSARTGREESTELWS